MNTFREISLEQENGLWKYIEKRFKFKPYRNIKLRIKSNTPFRIIDFSHEIKNNNIDEIYKNKNELLLELFHQLKNTKKIIGMNWRHICYEFYDVSKESFGNNEWPSCIFPDGDYVFLISEDMNNIVFGDGIDHKIYIIGDGW